MVSYNGLLKRISKDYFLTIKEKRIFQSEFEELAIIPKKVLRIFENYDSIELLKNYQKNGMGYSLFRFSDKKYFDYMIIEYLLVGIELKILDGYLFSTGSWFSEELKTIKIIKDENSAESFDEGYGLYSIRKAIRNNKFDKAIEAYQSIPNEIKKKEAFEIINLYLISKLEGREFEDRVLQFNIDFPNKKNYSLYLSILRYHTFKNCDRLEKSVLEFSTHVFKDSLLMKLINDCAIKI